MDPIAKTAYYCCGVRAEDARRDMPLCGDTLAQRFMTPEAEDIYSRFRAFKAPNATNAARHRQVDDWLRAALAATPERLILLLGAGFDTRAFRLRGGRWVEFDQASIIAEKSERLPAQDAPNPLTRVAIDFTRERLIDKLRPYAGEQPIVVLEGVSMYLTQAQLGETLGALKQTFPDHTLICDLMTARFAARYGLRLRERIRALGGEFAPLVARPEDTVTAGGYRLEQAVSLPGLAIALGGLHMPKWLLNTAFRSLRDGYRLFRFGYGR